LVVATSAGNIFFFFFEAEETFAQHVDLVLSLDFASCSRTFDWGE